MNDGAELYDPAKVEALIREATAAAVSLGCNMLECSQAFRALYMSALYIAAGNAPAHGGEDPE